MIKESLGGQLSFQCLHYRHLKLSKMNSTLHGQMICADQVVWHSIKEVQAYNKIPMTTPNNFQVADKVR